MTPIEEVAHLADLPVEVEVQLDRRTMKLGEVLALDLGSVIEMGRSAGEHIDVLIGSRLVAYGEIVVMESLMGVRITDFNVEQ